MKKILVLDPESEFIKVVDTNKCTGLKFYYDGQLQFRRPDSYLLTFDKVCCVNSANVVNQFLISRARSLGVYTVIVADGVYEWENAYNNPKHTKFNYKLYDPIISDALWLVGTAPLKYLSSSNSNIDFQKIIPSRMEVSMLDADSKSKPRAVKVLLTTARTPFFSSEERERLVKLLNKVVVACRKLEVELSCRFFDEKLFSEIDCNDNSTSGGFSEVVKSFDLVITTPSSISYEVMVLGKPLVHLDYRDSPLFVQSGWRVHSSVDIVAVLKDALSPSIERLNFQYSQCEDVYEGNACFKDLFLINKSQKKSELIADTDFYASKVLLSRWNFNLLIGLKVILKKIGMR